MIYESLYGLKPEDYQHPGEKIAMAALKKIPLLDVVMAKVIDARVQMDSYAETVGNCYRITEKTNPRVYRIYKLALARLGVKDEYPIFSKMSYDYNAYATGVEKPFIVLHSSVVSNYSNGELLNIIGHEIGHIKSGHMLYHNLANSLNGILGSLGKIGQSASVALQFALMEWHRNSEYTADRAGLIATGDIDAVNTETMKMLGHSASIPDIDFSVEKVLQQADDFKMDTSGIIGKLLYINYTANSTHPWAILRLKQINDWYNSGEYQSLVEKHS